MFPLFFPCNFCPAYTPGIGPVDSHSTSSGMSLTRYTVVPRLTHMGVTQGQRFAFQPLFMWDTERGCPIITTQHKWQEMAKAVLQTIQGDTGDVCHGVK